MPICSPNLIHSFLTICKNITFKVDENLFFPMLEGDIKVVDAKKTTFLSRNEMWDFIFLFLSKLDSCLQNFIPSRGVGRWEKIYLSLGNMLKFIWRLFLENKKCMLKFVVLNIQTVSTCFGVSHTYVFVFCFLKEHQNSKFWWYFKVLEANCLWGDFCWFW
jgi:hypothetical protein